MSLNSIVCKVCGKQSSLMWYRFDAMYPPLYLQRICQDHRQESDTMDMSLAMEYDRQIAEHYRQGTPFDTACKRLNVSLGCRCCPFFSRSVMEQLVHVNECWINCQKEGCKATISWEEYKGHYQACSERVSYGKRIPLREEEKKMPSIEGEWIDISKRLNNMQLTMKDIQSGEPLVLLKSDQKAQNAISGTTSSNWKVGGKRKKMLNK